MRTTEMDRIRCTIMRGGTSKGIFVHEADMPPDRADRDRVILALFGTPDPRQIDGLGGADVLTSKFAMIGPSSREDADVDYTFVQVGVASATLDYNGNCGNISAAVGPFAIEEGLVRAEGEITQVRIYNTNTGKVFIAHVPITNAHPRVRGTFGIAGVPGTGASILLDYSKTTGAVTGSFFPTGNLVDDLEVEGIGTFPMTLADVANPVVYLRASDLGLQGTEGPPFFDGDRELNRKLEHIRSHAAVAFGMVEDWRDATHECSLFPLLTVVSEPAGYEPYGSEGSTKIATDDVDIVVRMQALQQTHKTYAGTGTANLGATAMVPGTLVHEALRPSAVEVGRVRFGHPSGVAEVVARTEKQGDGTWVVETAGYERTARRIMEGYAYVKLDEA